MRPREPESSLTTLARRASYSSRSRWPDAIAARPLAVVLAALLSTGFAAIASGAKEAKISSILTSADNGKTVDLRVGAEAELRLRENPSTGYRWALDAADSRLVAIEEGEYVSTAKMIGAGGETQWLIRAKAPGLTEIKLKRWRPWEGERSVVERYQITLRISL